MAGFVAMISVFVVVCVEMFFALKGAGHVHGSEYDHIIGGIGRGSSESTIYQNAATNYYRLDGQDTTEDIHLGGIHGIGRAEPLRQASNPRRSTDTGSQAHFKDTDGDEENDDDLEALDPYPEADSYLNSSRSHHALPHPSSHRSPYPNGQVQPTADSNMQNPQRQLLQCLLLEAGILFHSVFIGMAVSVATGTSFVILLVAISFHQTFEGFALGSRIASLIPDLFSPSSMKPWLMALAYGTTTPIGQALGLVLHNLYDPASTTGLLMVGITNAISSGLLLFAGLVELLAEDFLSESSYATLRGRRRIEACLAVAGGALLMAFVGAFA
ncbi:ZIP family zinc transporter [Aspergillus sclerotialis]|uniref:ZIP family zinc transporter n=1 Tax=Aspergillus sclerotialis TaxID=2070753 RepID=A0A3A2ZRD1_9EURO|nr:ZIP family zinc transporter [Aspergillus sclerotialis]